MYHDSSNSEQSMYVQQNAVSKDYVNKIKNYIIYFGTPLEKLEYGQTKYSFDGLGVVVDDDCMAKDSKDVIKYLILRPNCKLYTQWDDKASLIF